jgi:hypothetical protein
MELFLLAFLFLGVCALLGAAIGWGRGRTIAGFFLGGIFGPIGIVILLLLDRKPRREDCETAMAEPAVRSPSPLTDSPIGRENVEALLDLKRLLDAGVISADEYEVGRKRLLNSSLRGTVESSVRYR